MSSGNTTAHGGARRPPATTLRVPTATRQLTLDRRYPATTMADVAAAAGVAVHAVCSATGGGKATLAQRVATSPPPGTSTRCPSAPSMS
jgi:hypothetical protein